MCSDRSRNYRCLGLSGGALSRFLRVPLAIFGNASLTAVVTLVDLPLGCSRGIRTLPAAQAGGFGIGATHRSECRPESASSANAGHRSPDVMAVQVVVSVLNFAGKVTSPRVYASFASDPEQDNAAFDTIAAAEAESTNRSDKSEPRSWDETEDREANYDFNALAHLDFIYFLINTYNPIRANSGDDVAGAQLAQIP